MKEMLHQGDIIKIESIKSPVLVTSKDFFNQTGEIIGCPIFTDSVVSPLHIKIQADSGCLLDSEYKIITIRNH